ncbi:MAG: glutathione binding-like protein, partial [Myxococcota bacterium]
ECGHFRRLGEEAGDQSYAVRRFTDEANRLYGVMNGQLYDRPYLAGDQLSIADIASYPWCEGWERQGQDMADFKHLRRWFEELSARPAFVRGMQAGSELGMQRGEMSKEEIERVKALLYNQRARPAPDER